MIACSIAKTAVSVSLIAAASLAATPASAQQYQPFGEVRGYPSGVIITGGLGLPLRDDYYASVHIGYDIAERGNNGKFDDESGGGFGFGGTLDKYFRPGQNGWFVGGRVELFFLDIDYRDPGVSGSSDITVFQPTARGGYGWTFGGGHYGLQAGVSLGAEINVGTAGRKVGQGAIALGGLAFTFKP